MKNFALALLLLATVPLFASPADEAEIRTVIGKYFAAHATGEAAPLFEAFHPEWRMLSVREGALATRSREEFAAGFKGTPAADEAQRKRTIEMIDVSGTAAIAKLRLDYPAVEFVDYMLLLKVDGRWQVVTKSFHATRKKPSS